MSVRATIRSQLRQRLKIDDKKRVWSDDTLNLNINVALRNVERYGDFEWPHNDATNTENTVASQREYDLPSDFVRVEMATVKYDTTPLAKETYENLFREYASLDNDGRPSLYYIRGNKMGLYSRPDSVKVLEYLYRKRTADFSDDSTDNGVSSDFDEAIVQYARYHCWNDVQGRQDFALQSFQAYKEEMEGLYSQYLGRRDESNFQMEYETIYPTTQTPYFR